MVLTSAVIAAQASHLSTKWTSTGRSRRFDECRTTAYAVRVEASELGMMQNGRGDRPECPHIKLGNRRMTGEALIHEMRTSVGILTAEQNNSQRKPGVVRD